MATNPNIHETMKSLLPKKNQTGRTRRRFIDGEKVGPIILNSLSENQPQPQLGIQIHRDPVLTVSPLPPPPPQPVVANFVCSDPMMLFRFLHNCFTCQKVLTTADNIYIYGGDSSFCTEVCRAIGMVRARVMNGARKEVIQCFHSSRNVEENNNGSIFFIQDMS